MQWLGFGRAGLNTPVIDSRHLLDFPTKNIPIEVGKLCRLLTVDLEVC